MWADYNALIAVLTGRSRVKFANYSLEGPPNSPTHPIVVAAVYPKVDDLPNYRMIAVSEMGEIDVDDLRRRILSYKVPAHAAEIQRELLAQYHNLDEMLAMINDIIICEDVMAEGLPLFFILFGITDQDKLPTAHIFHHHALTTVACLEELQNLVRKQIQEGK